MAFTIIHFLFLDLAMGLFFIGVAICVYDGFFFLLYIEGFVFLAGVPFNDGFFFLFDDSSSAGTKLPD